MHVYKGLLRCKSVCDVKPGLDPCPLLARSWNRWWLDFMTFIAFKKVRLRSKRSSAFRTGAMIYLSEKYILGLGVLSVFNNRHHYWWVCIHAVHTCNYRASIEIKATKIDNSPIIKKILQFIMCMCRFSPVPGKTNALYEYLLFNTQCHCSLSALNHWLQS